MTEFVLRDRPDGTVEIIYTMPCIVAVGPNRTWAEGVLRVLRGQPASKTPEKKNTSDVPAPIDRQEPASGAAILTVEPVASPPTRALAVINAPRPPSRRAEGKTATALEPELLAEAIARIESGESVAAVAHALDVSFPSLRGRWAAHAQSLQREAAAAGPVPCAICQRAFIPSISNPDTCARCSRD